MKHDLMGVYMAHCGDRRHHFCTKKTWRREDLHRWDRNKPTLWWKVVGCGELWSGGLDQVFMGEFQHTVDPKGRVFIPAKFRESLGDRCVVTRGLDQCLFVYTPTEWTAMEDKLKRLPMTQSDARAFVRFFFSGAVDVELDKQGRIMLPSNLREYANLGKDAIIIGVSTRVEIWSKEIWERYMENAAQSFEAIAEKIVDLGI